MGSWLCNDPDCGGKQILTGKRSALFVSVCMVPFLLVQRYAMAADAPASSARQSSAVSAGQRKVSSSPGYVSGSVSGVSPGSHDVIEHIDITGNSRIETNTVLSYMVVQSGDYFSQDDLDRSLKTLFATGLFKDVRLRREGNVLKVNLVENPIVNRIVFEGNSAAKEEDLRKVIALRPRAVFSAETAADDRQKILDVYAEKARYAAVVTPQIVRLSHNRVDVVFHITEGPQTLIRKIAFVGNKAYGDLRLAGIVSSKETAWFRFMSSADEYNPERLKYDAELLRRFYLSNGYVDFQMKDVSGELSPDRKSFYVTYTMDEGQRYRLGKVDIRSSLRHVPAKSLRKYVELFAHQWYDGKAVQDNATDMEETLQAEGHPFAMVRPVIARNPEKGVVNLLFDVSEGPRRYIERLDINGNTITEDSVIRRQMPFAEGDPYTPSYKKYAKESVQDLGFFKSVDVQDTPGSAQDKTNVAVNVVEKPTGEFSLGGGYSTDVGVIGNIGLKQHNLLGTGVDAGLSGTMSQWQRQVDLSVTNPAFLGRNLVAGVDIFGIQNKYQTYQNYSESRVGITLRMGYAYNRYLSQSWNYTLTRRHVGLAGGGWYQPSLYVIDQKGNSLLSQIGTNLVYDRRDNRMNPHNGYMVSLGGDFAGLGGDEKYGRVKVNASYYIPLDDLTNSHDWTIVLRAGAGYMGDWGNGRHDIIDNFYLGGQNLRGFLDGGAGPRSKGYGAYPGEDLLGGRYIYNASAQLNFPMPFLSAMGVMGRTFVDTGSLWGLRVKRNLSHPWSDPYQGISGDRPLPRVSAGAGFSWKSPFGLLNIDLGVPIMRSHNDRTQLIRFGFGQQF
ncbi:MULTISPECIES: outer membrane protein assembly factor BamA [Acetobacter]|uniref:Outer membrane protein assembly factor BamA n=1 Tax=Acetobacter thailandicus TaxID=1502842 RepID=A0ABT3QBW3_9PROT|nr:MULTISPECIES: outer membrane protein assembly factor BamA [Acetobacter]MBS0980448.1 outer membrane protein assembly factor BamA [Acetobacter thailandicus]MBS0985019.1 outer membrane protein assembly factor BamA [Acetobacter thailandicus]MBS1003442.1 outer membrane protein assembly factor BamA [Acetobacter thailandicus]MCX2562724.1 outer membrane protein assembly factor BamA [Acetobacter thailandicus]NHN94789.1 outer membrane protein assembly factor BamA [Acetobacter thailandicus]